MLLHSLASLRFVVMAAEINEKDSIFLEEFLFFFFFSCFLIVSLKFSIWAVLDLSEFAWDRALFGVGYAWRVGD